MAGTAAALRRRWRDPLLHLLLASIILVLSIHTCVLVVFHGPVERNFRDEWTLPSSLEHQQQLLVTASSTNPHPRPRDNNDEGDDKK